MCSILFTYFYKLQTFLLVLTFLHITMNLVFFQINDLSEGTGIILFLKLKLQQLWQVRPFHRALFIFENFLIYPYKIWQPYLCISAPEMKSSISPKNLLSGTQVKDLKYHFAFWSDFFHGLFWQRLKKIYVDILYLILILYII